MKPYRYIQLSAVQTTVLESCFQKHEKAHVRMRSHAILLSSRGWKVPDIAELYSKQRDTIRDWFDSWEKEGLAGLLISKGRGRKAVLCVENLETVALVKKK
jgi:transposase